MWYFNISIEIVSFALALFTNFYKQFSFNQVFMPKCHAIECTQAIFVFFYVKTESPTTVQHNVCLKLQKPVSMSIKGIVAWDFGLLVFSQSHRSGLPIHIVKYFWILFQFAEVFEFKVSLTTAIQVFCEKFIVFIK